MYIYIYIFFKYKSTRLISDIYIYVYTWLVGPMNRQTPQRSLQGVFAPFIGRLAGAFFPALGDLSWDLNLC